MSNAQGLDVDRMLLTYGSMNSLPDFSPCQHKGKCTKQKKDCTCSRSNRPCEKHCSCFPSCQNIRCACPGTCDHNCACFKLSRECDPDVCTCKACKTIDSKLNISRPGALCLNMQFQLRTQKSTIVAASERLRRLELQGAGLYLDEPCKKGDLVVEYCGLVTPDKPDRHSNYAYRLTPSKQ